MKAFDALRIKSVLICSVVCAHNRPVNPEFNDHPLRAGAKTS